MIGAMAAELSFNEVKPTLDPFNSLFDAIQAAVYPRKSLFNMRGADFQILHVTDKQIHALFHAGEPPLNLLQDRDDDVRDLAHCKNIAVLRLFCKRTMEPSP